MFKLIGRSLIYRPLVGIYQIYRHFKRRTINYYQQNVWLSVIVLMVIAIFITFNNWQESDRLMAAEDLVRDTWLSKMIGDEFNQLNDIIVDSQPGHQFNLNRPQVVDSRLTMFGSINTGSTAVVGITTDRWVYGWGLVGLPTAGQSIDTPVGRKTISYYTVKIGDTLSGIANNFGITVNTIIWQNGLSLNTLLRPGDKLTILPTSGVLYKIKAGDNLSKIARQYSIDAETISSYNNLTGDRVIIGQSLIIPGGKPPAAPVGQIAQATNLAPKVQQVFTTVKKTVVDNLPSGGGMTWPTSGHRITQYYSLRHNGIDIANKVGTPIYAADNGKVELSASGWNGGYGNTILINHGKLKTRYGHLSRLYVKAGQTVEKGQVIGEMGSTGRSTGPHLHFEVLSGSVRYNPLNYVR